MTFKDTDHIAAAVADCEGLRSKMASSLGGLHSCHVCPTAGNTHQQASALKVGRFSLNVNTCEASSRQTRAYEGRVPHPISCNGILNVHMRGVLVASVSTSKTAIQRASQDHHHLHQHCHHHHYIPPHYITTTQTVPTLSLPSCPSQTQTLCPYPPKSLPPSPSKLLD